MTAVGAPLPGVLPGWDGTKWTNPNHTTPKYVIGRILAKYPPTVEGLRRAIPELQQAFPGLTFNGKDKIVVPGLGPKGVDVLQGASGGGVAWQWIDTDAEAQGGGFAGNPGNPGVGPGPLPPAVGGWFGGGGGGNTGGGSWTMPRGSAYQFGGVPGFTGGAFGLPQSDAGGLSTQGVPWGPGVGPTGVMTSPGSMPLSTTGPTFAPPIQGMNGSGAFGLPGQPPTSQGDVPLSTSGQPFGPGGQTPPGGPSGSPGGDFGSGMLSQPIPSGLSVPSGPGGVLGGPSMMTTDLGQGGTKQPPVSGGGYDHAPAFTPLDPFQAPPVPGAYPEWKGSAFDVGLGAEKFQLPTGQAALDQDPGYQFRIDQGLAALGQSAAARGLLRTGGSLKDVQDFGQRAASQEYQNAVDRAMAVAGFNENNRRAQLGLGLAANDQNNRYGLAGAQFNADQIQQNYQNKYGAANQGYAYANQQNMAGNAQALSGYQTDVSRDLGLRGLNITAEQNAFMNSLNAQQQQWMQIYMQNGQSFDQAYRMMMAKLQYPA